MAALIQYANGVPAIIHTIEKLATTIGRDFENDIPLLSDFISQKHAVLEVVIGLDSQQDYQFYIRDLESTNHTYVNEQVISGRVKLKRDDTILIGNEKFLFDDSYAAIDDISGHDIEQAEEFQGLEQVKQDQNNQSGLFSRRINRFV